MTFSSPLGLLPTRRRRESKKQVKPINVDAAQRFQGAGPSSSSSNMPTPKPTDRRTSPNPTNDPETTFLTPPPSPYEQMQMSPVKSPLRRAFSRTFFSRSCNTAGSGTPSPRSSPPLQISAPFRAQRPSTSSSTETGTLSPQASVSSRRRSKTLLPSVVVRDDAPSRPARPSTSSSRIRSFWGGESSSAESTPSLSSSPQQSASPNLGSLRSIRQMHVRAKSSFNMPTTPLPAEPVSRPHTPQAPRPATKAHKLKRRASEESFFCRGLGFDECTPELPTSATMPGRRMSDFTKSSYDHFWNVANASRDLLSENTTPTQAVAGLGFTDCSPEAPRPKTKRLSMASQVSDISSIINVSSYASSEAHESTASHRQSWPEVPTQWFSSCPPTPPSSIRLNLQFSALPTGEEVDAHPQPIDALFISSNNSVLDLKEILAERLNARGYIVLPRELSLSLHLADFHASRSSLGLAFSAQGCSPIKELANNSRLLFEEGAQEDDTMLVRYLPFQPDTRFF